MSYSNRMGNKGVWCPLKELYFPQIYAFTGRERDDDGTPLAWLYTLDPKVATLHSARPAAASISWIDRDGPIGRRTHSLVLRHHDTLVLRHHDTLDRGRRVPVWRRRRNEHVRYGCTTHASLRLIHAFATTDSMQLAQPHDFLRRRSSRWRHTTFRSWSRLRRRTARNGFVRN